MKRVVRPYAKPSGGTIDVSAENVTSDSEDHPPFRERAYVRISVRDTGCGIEEAHLPRVFDPYFTTKNRGTQKGMGLGLAMCHSIVRQHNGFIDVESTVGIGTKFSIYLPAL